MSTKNTLRSLTENNAELSKKMEKVYLELLGLVGKDIQHNHYYKFGDLLVANTLGIEYNIDLDKQKNTFDSIDVAGEELASSIIHAALYLVIKERFNQDIIVKENLTFGNKDFARQLEDLYVAGSLDLFVGEKSKNLTEEMISSNMLAALDKNLTYEEYIQDLKYFERDLEILSKLTKKSGSRYVDGINSTRDKDNIRMLLEGDESISEVVDQNVHLVRNVYTTAFQGSFELEKYDSVLCMTDRIPAFSISSKGVMKQPTITKVTEEGKRTLQLNPRYQNFANYFRNLYITTSSSQGKTDKCVVSKHRQWDVKEMVTSDSPVYNPYKIAEYVYGRKSTYQLNKPVYLSYTGKQGWENYYSNYVEENIKTVFYDTVMYTLETEGLLTDKGYKTITEEAYSKIEENLQKVRYSLCTFFLLVERTGRNVSWASFRLRMCTPFLKKDNIEKSIVLVNKLLDDVFKGAKNTRGGETKTTPEIITEMVDLNIVDYQHTMDLKIANGRPIFAYKALDILQEKGEDINVNNLILGRNVDGTILKSNVNSKVNLTQALLHFIIAASRSGKGVMTLSMLAGHIASDRPVFYIDRKPDMTSTLVELVGRDSRGMPNMFILNGGNYQAQFDPHNLLNPEENKEFIFKNIPKWWEFSEYEGQLGDLIYYRGILFTLGLIQLRMYLKTNPEEYAKFNGTEGITVIWDEYTNWQNAFGSCVINPAGWFSPDIIVSEEDISNARIAVSELSKLITKMSNGEELTSKETNKKLDYEAEIEKIKDMKRLYLTDMFYNLARSSTAMFEKINAGLKGGEASYSDIFIIGQNLEIEPIHAEVGYKYNHNRGKPYSNQKVLNRDPILSITNKLPRDFLLGYNSGYPKYLYANSPTSILNDKLTAEARNFAYCHPSMELDTVKGLNQSVDYINREVVPFKPYLILNNAVEPKLSVPLKETKEVIDYECGIPECSYVGTMIKTIYENMGAKVWDAIREENVDEENNLRQEIGFIPYILKASNGKDVKATLRKSLDIANYVVEKMGYPGDFYDFIYDLRPEWNFGAEDIVDAFRNPEDFKRGKNRLKWYNEIYGPESILGALEKANKDVEEIEDDDYIPVGNNYEEDVDDMHKNTETQLNKIPTSETMEKGSLVNELQEITSEKEIEKGVINTSKNIATKSMLNASGYDIRNQTKNEKGEVEEIFTYTKDVELFDNIDFDMEDEATSMKKYYELCQYLTITMIKDFGGLNAIKTIEVNSGNIIINKVKYKANITNDELISSVPLDKKMLLKNGKLSTFINFALFKQCTNLVYFKVDSLNFLKEKVFGELGITNPKPTPNDIFRSLPTKHFILNGKEFTRDGVNFGDSESYVRKKEYLDKQENYLRKTKQQSWDKAKTAFSRRGIGSKFTGLLFFGFGLTAKSGEIATKSGKGLFSAIRNMFKD